MKDPRIAKLIAELERRFPGTTAVTGPMADAPDSGETLIELLNAPTSQPRLVDDVAHRLIDEMWGDDWLTALVGAVGPEDTAKYYADRLAKELVRRDAAPRRPSSARRRRPAKQPR